MQFIDNINLIFTNLRYNYSNQKPFRSYRFGCIQLNKEDLVDIAESVVDMILNHRNFNSNQKKN